MGMKCACLTLAMLLVAAAGTTAAQESPAPVANPVSTTVKNQLTRFSKNMVAAAESMPADKYGFKPTPEMNSFGHLMIHIVESNNLLCSKISGVAAPDSKLADTDGKDKLVGQRRRFEARRIAGPVWKSAGFARRSTHRSQRRLE
jgi:hypothetical protein